MAQMAPPTSQFIVASCGFYSHNRHLLCLSQNLLAMHSSLCITYLTTPSRIPTIKTLLAAANIPKEQDARFRMIPVGEYVKGDELWSLTVQEMAAYAAGIDGLLGAVLEWTAPAQSARQQGFVGNPSDRSTC